MIIAAPHPAVDVVHDEVVRHVSVGEHGLHPRVAHHPAGDLRVAHPPGVVAHGLALRDFKYELLYVLLNPTLYLNIDGVVGVSPGSGPQHEHGVGVARLQVGAHDASAQPGQ